MADAAVTSICMEGTKLVAHGMNELHATSVGALNTGAAIILELIRQNAAQRQGDFTGRQAAANRILTESGHGSVRYNPNPASQPDGGA